MSSLSFYPLLPDSDDDVGYLEAQVSRGVNRRVTSYPRIGMGVQSIKDQPPYFLSSNPDSDDPGVWQVCIVNQGSKPQYVLVENIPARGVINSGCDITIMGGELFSHAVTVLRMQKSQFRKPEKVPKTYSGRNFELNGMVDFEMVSL